MTALISEELLGRVDGLSATIAGNDGTQRPCWCFGKPDGIDVRCEPMYIPSLIPLFDDSTHLRRVAGSC